MSIFTGASQSVQAIYDQNISNRAAAPISDARETGDSYSDDFLISGSKKRTRSSSLRHSGASFTDITDDNAEVKRSNRSNSHAVVQIDESTSSRHSEIKVTTEPALSTSSFVGRLAHWRTPDMSEGKNL